MLNFGECFSSSFNRPGLGFSVVVLALILGCNSLAGDIASQTLSDDEKAPRAPVCCKLIGLYQRAISPIGANSCRMNPSCSEYSRQAFARYGFARGMLLTTDRLMRDTFFSGSDYPLTFVGGKWLYHDPLSENTFWWSRYKGRTVVGHKE
ncbi:MAG: membrane protein insertion efficiency factor YidD [Candidatus Coatesbacteria bacterium]|nr:membrane protein insertion efficiency factor YidD [Candidatus Coatesbacteria bacterium]